MRDQRLVHQLHGALAAGVLGHRQQPRRHQTIEHPLRLGGLARGRKQLGQRHDGARFFAGDQPQQQAATSRLLGRREHREDVVGVRGQRAERTAQRLVGRAGQPLPTSVARLPKPIGGEGKQRQRRVSVAHRFDDRRRQLFILEGVAERFGRPDQDAKSASRSGVVTISTVWLKTPNSAGMVASRAKKSSRTLTTTRVRPSG
jgi:hypothetical protein